jgi:hypothetical protein
MLDINGDDLVDSVHVDGSDVFIAMNTGHTFATGTLAPALTDTSAFSKPNEVRIGDFNDDGLDDL